MFNKKLKEQLDQQKVLIDMQWEIIKEMQQDIEQLEKELDNVSNILNIELIRANDRADYLEILNRQFSEEA